MVQLSMEGYPNQYCGAYVLGLRREEGFAVNVVFRLCDSSRLLVYVHGRPLANQGAYRRALQEARRFLQVVGMETEPCLLPAAPRSRAQLLARFPIFAASTAAAD